MTTDLEDTLDQLQTAVGGLRGTVRRLRVWMAAVGFALLVSVGAWAALWVSTRHAESARHDVRCSAIVEMDQRMRGRTVDALGAWSTQLVGAFIDDEAAAESILSAIADANAEADRVMSRPVTPPGC